MVFSFTANIFQFNPFMLAFKASFPNKNIGFIFTRFKSEFLLSYFAIHP